MTFLLKQKIEQHLRLPWGYLGKCFSKEEKKHLLKFPYIESTCVISNRFFSYLQASDQFSWF